MRGLWSRRKQSAFRPELARGVLNLALGEIFVWLRTRAAADVGVEDGQTGAATAQRRLAPTSV